MLATIVGLGTRFGAADDRSLALPMVQGGNNERRLRPPRGAKPPPAVYEQLGRRFGVHPRRLHDALERIKDNAGLPPRANTRVDADGNVYIERTGEWIGNLVDGV